MKKQILLFALIFLFVNQVYSQYWLKFGNPPAGLNGVFPPVNNFLGTDAGNTNFFRLGTNGLERMRLNHLPFTGFLQPYNTSILNPLPGNRMTRVSINRDGNAPITQPLSLARICNPAANRNIK